MREGVKREWIQTSSSRPEVFWGLAVNLQGSLANPTQSVLDSGRQTSTCTDVYGTPRKVSTNGVWHLSMYSFAVHRYGVGKDQEEKGDGLLVIRLLSSVSKVTMSLSTQTGNTNKIHPTDHWNHPGTILVCLTFTHRAVRVTDGKQDQLISYTVSYKGI